MHSNCDFSFRILSIILFIIFYFGLFYMDRFTHFTLNYNTMQNKGHAVTVAVIVSSNMHAPKKLSRSTFIDAFHETKRNNWRMFVLMLVFFLFVSCVIPGTVFDHPKNGKNTLAITPRMNLLEKRNCLIFIVAYFVGSLFVSKSLHSEHLFSNNFVDCLLSFLILHLYF